VTACNAVTRSRCPDPAVFRVTSMCVHEHESVTFACRAHADRQGAVCGRCWVDAGSDSHVCLVSHVERTDLRETM
jgi:hypothetical protein